ncbi:MAG: LacI family DNA-binding transcriptional regulator [Opitutales bacterium]|nr:LacI family DNA-binding transcriptional regulator [Opitutales bacterium]MCH8539139.1 LacI family transcriptional regulator [Opitutales bacterium]
MNPSPVTLKDIAQAAGVSVMTVSYALRGSKQVAAATRDRIQELARKMGYAPDPMMSRLATYRTQKKRTERRETLAWLNLHPTEATWKFRGSHVLEAFEGAQKRAPNFGYSLDMFSVPQLGGWAATNKVLRARGIQGLVIGQPPDDDSYVAELEWKYFATVAIGRAIQSPNLPRVVLNHVEAINRLIDQLNDRGYRRIGLVMEKEACRKNAFRNVSAYHGACERRETPPDQRVPPLLPDALTAEILGQWINEWKVEAIIVNRPDQMQTFLPQLGLQIPRDIGFAHLSLPGPDPWISGFQMNPEYYGSWAVDLVHWLLNREEKGLPDPAPTLNLTTLQWNEGQTLRPVKT